MRTLFTLFSLCIALPLVSSELDRPARISIHTWVREDLFAASMANDWERLEIGARKVNAALEKAPDDFDILGWKHFEHSVRAYRAHEAGDGAAMKEQLEKAAAIRARVKDVPAEKLGANITIGGSLVLSAPRLPEPLREAMYREGRERLNIVRSQQAQYWDKLPVHFRGEMLSLLGFAADNLGDKAERDKLTEEMLTSLAGTVYENRAKRWKSMPELRGAAQGQCLTCHEPGRLQARLEVIKNAK